MTKEKENSSFVFISPKPETVIVNGDLFYSESRQAWSIIRFKKELLHEFPQLKEKRINFGYTIIIHRSYEELKKAISKFEKNKEVTPMLLSFWKKKQE